MDFSKQWLTAKQRHEETKGEILKTLYFDLFWFFIVFHNFIYYGNQNGNISEEKKTNSTVT